MSIPNLLSLLRLVLVPVFAVVFFQPAPDAHRWAVLIYLTAFLTDVADGWIARHFNQITKLGRILDPLADKLMTFLKELTMAIGGYLMYQKLGDVISSNWLGKTSTGVFFVVCAALVLFPAIPRPWATGLISFALALTLAALCSYIFQYRKALKKRKQA